MTQDEIIEMARQTQMPFYWRTGEITYLDKLQAFANLVAQHEREACAKVCAEWSDYTKGIAPILAERIRARGQA
jgi:molybdopterin synthase catalytic subunit